MKRLRSPLYKFFMKRPFLRECTEVAIETAFRDIAPADWSCLENQSDRTLGRRSRAVDDLNLKLGLELLFVLLFRSD